MALVAVTTATLLGVAMPSMALPDGGGVVDPLLGTESLQAAKKDKASAQALRRTIVCIRFMSETSNKRRVLHARARRGAERAIT